MLLPAFFALLALAACRPPDRPVQQSVAGDSLSGQVAGAPAEGAVPASPPPPALHVDRKSSFYDVSGRDEAALLHDLQRRGPRIDGKRHFGRTRWSARWEIEYRGPARPGAAEGASPPCRMRRADVWLEVEVTLPRWKAPDGAPPALRYEWNAFSDALAVHEREHRESIVSVGRQVVDALETLEAPSCRALERKANVRAREIIEDGRAYNRRYDERTDHGRTQGARWPR